MRPPRPAIPIVSNAARQFAPITKHAPDPPSSGFANMPSTVAGRFSELQCKIAFSRQPHRQWAEFQEMSGPPVYWPRSQAGRSAFTFIHRQGVAILAHKAKLAVDDLPRLDRVQLAHAHTRSKRRSAVSGFQQSAECGHD